MLWSWRNFRAQAGRVDGHVIAQPCAPKPSGRVPSRGRAGGRRGVLTELLQEDACHLLGEHAAHPDEVGQVPPGAELHNQVDVVTVPLPGNKTSPCHPCQSHPDQFAQSLATSLTDTPMGSRHGSKPE